MLGTGRPTTLKLLGLALSVFLPILLCLSPAARATQPPAPPELEGRPGARAAGVTPSRQGAWVAKPLLRLRARSQPESGRIIATVDTETIYTRSATNLLVTAGRYDGEGRLWLQVALPIRPTGIRGWIPADAVMLKRTDTVIRISVSRRRVTVYRGGRRIRTMRAVVGKPATPTPRGLFAVYERARLANPKGFAGPWALHLTALSNVLFSFGAGNGRVAIHGRGPAALGDPLGSARSNGCIRLRNRDIQWLRQRAAPGTPVRVSR
jgi:lipoprotein-anchoring transpeptidase ErfK/SrfK